MIGINQYSKNPKLNNAANDGKEIAEKLKKLKYEVICLIDEKATYDDYVDAEEKIVGLLMEDKIQGVVLYFSGHGFMTDGKDCLVLADAEDMRVYGGLTAMRKSIKLDEFYGTMRKRGAEKVIAIVDACRSDLSMYKEFDGKDKGISINDNEFGRNTQMPYQTFLAFSTSPKTNAKDGTAGHSKYTEALLNEIEVEELPIEQLFKHIRKKVHQRDDDQLPWENSCLVDEFCFNYGQMNRHYESMYDKSCFSQKTDDEATNEDEIIVRSLLIDGYWNLTGKLSSLKKAMDSNVIFRIGRILIRLIQKGDLGISEILRYNKIGLFTENHQNHLLNGILYGFYFDRNDHVIKADGRDMQILDAIDKLCEHKDFFLSVKFIRKELEPFRKEISYIPGDEMQKVEIEIERATEGETEDGYDVWVIKDLYVKDGTNDGLVTEKTCMDNTELRNAIRDRYLIPLSKIKCQFSERTNREDLFVWDEFDIADILNGYFVGNCISDMDDICHHYEYVGIDDYYIQHIQKDEDYLRVKGTFSIEAIIYLDSEEEIKSDECIDGTFDIVLENNMSKWSVADVEDMTLDLSKYWK